jgi:hypothetical protein
MLKNISRIAVAAIIFAAAFHSDGGQQNTWLLRVRSKVGTSLKYAMTMNMVMDTANLPRQQNQGPMPKKINVNVTMAYNMLLKTIKAGKFSWKMTVTDAKMTSNMGPQAAEQTKQMIGKSSIIVTDARGKVLSVTGDAKLGLQGGVGQQGFTGVPFPEKPVRPGSTWSETIKGQNMSMTFNYKVIGTKVVRGGKALYLTGTVTGSPMIATPTPINFLINPSTGELISSSGKMKMTVMVPADMTFSVVRK